MARIEFESEDQIKIESITSSPQKLYLKYKRNIKNEMISQFKLMINFPRVLSAIQVWRKNVIY